MTELLQLSEKENIRFFTKLNKIEEKKRSFYELRGKSIKELKLLLRKKGENEDALSSVINTIQKAQLDLEKTQKKFHKELKSELTIEQYAKYLIFESEFQKEIRDIIEKIKKLEKNQENQSPRKKDRTRSLF